MLYSWRIMRVLYVYITYMVVHEQYRCSRKHCDANYQCPPTDNSCTVQALLRFGV